MRSDLLSDTARIAQCRRWLHGVLGPVDFILERASTDAGFRSYWRVLTGESSLIVMDAPPDLEPVVPWLRVHALLDAGGVCVPGVLAENVEQGFLLLEDLGAKTCLHLLAPDTADGLFTAAIDQLLQMQAIRLPADFPRYDSRLLLRDLRLFDEWFLHRHLGITLDEMSTRRLHEVYRFLIESALAQPQVLVHRDFISRNLMPIGDVIAMIDFQDAVRGPLGYDVLSLFKDAFISWPEADVERWTRDYHQRAGTTGLPVPDWAQFQRDIDLIGVHRHLKVLGIFSRLRYRDDKPDYILDAMRFVRYLDAVVPKYPELAALDEILALHVQPSVMGET